MIKKVTSIVVWVGLMGSAGAELISNGDLDSTNWVDNVSVLLTSVEPTIEYVNLAKYQITTADSKDSSATQSSFATDGFAAQDSRWATSSDAPHWLAVELATPMRIGSAHLYSGTPWGYIVSDFVLQYEVDGSWVDIPGATRSGNALPVLNIEFNAPITAQKFRLYTTDSDPRIKELALYPPTADGSPVPFGSDIDLNVAKLRQFAYSSVSGENYPKLALDGYAHNASGWASANTAGPHDLEVHLPQAEAVNGIHLYSGYTGVAGTQIEDFEVAYHDGADWVLFDGGSVSGNTELNRGVMFNTVAITTKIRIRSLDDSQAFIREFAVMPDDGGVGYPLWTDVKNEAPSSLSFLDYEDSYYTLENRSSGLNLSTSTDGSITTSDEPWFQVLLNLGTDTYRLRSKDSERCFEVAQASTNEGAAIVEGTYSTAPHQRWRLVDSGDGTHVQIVNVWSGMALGVDGTAVVQQELSTDQSQQWKINYEDHVPKRGQAAHIHFNTLFKPSWIYDWRVTPKAPVSIGQYMPMQWGGINSVSPTILNYQAQWYRQGNPVSVLGYNEPDKSEQANVDEVTAAYRWPRLSRMRLPLVGPCPAQHNGSWRQNYEAIAEEQGLRSEYMALHWYAGCNGGSPQNIINVINSVYNAYGKPIWITEFAVKDWSGNSTGWDRKDNYNWLAEFLWRSESIAALKKFSMFEWGNSDSSADINANDAPTMGLHNSNDSSNPGFEDLSEIGLLMAGWDGDDMIRDEKPYILHNKLGMRLIDDPAESTIGSSNILNRASTEQFELQAGPNGSKYIVGLSSGRRLSCDGSTVSLVASETTGTAVEWEITTYQYGWVYIDHPATSKRLLIYDSGSVEVTSDSNAWNSTTFRFIAPWHPLGVMEKQTLPYAESFEAGTGALGQSDTDDFDWSIGRGATPTVGTGPSAASDGNQYLFLEQDDSEVQYKTAQIEGLFDFSTIPGAELQFDYHMFGADIDFLALDVYDGATWISNVWIRSGTQHSSSEDAWSTAAVNLDAFAGNDDVMLRFRGKQGSGQLADMAIDNIRLEQSSESLPYAEGFESGLGSWKQVSDDDYDWSIGSGETATVGAGPSAASHGLQYLFTEGHDGGAYTIASVENAFDLRDIPSAELTFDYHMYGSYIDYLSLDVHDGTSWTLDVWKRSGQQQSDELDPFLPAVVDLSAFVGNPRVTLRFNAKNKRWNASDTAIDNLRVQGPPPTLPYTESFERNLGAWDQSSDDDFDWSQNSGGTPTGSTGPNGASDGSQYLVLEQHDSSAQYKTGIMDCVLDFSTVSNVELSFDYHMYGQNIDYLAVDVYDGSTWATDVWKLSGAQHTSHDDPWSTAVVDLSAYAGNSAVTLRFRGKEKQWHLADIAIDNIRVEEPSAYTQWVADAFNGAPGGTDTTATGNPDSDRFNNQMEWVLNLDPLTADQPVMDAGVSADTFVVLYERRDPAVTGIDVYASWAPSLLAETWRVHGDGMTERSNGWSNEVETVSASLPLDHTNAFIRIQVEE